MLDVLRASKGGLISWIFLVALILVFAFVGPGSSAWSSRGGAGCAGTGGAAYAAHVNGQAVPLRDFAEQSSQAERMLAGQYGEEMARRFAPQMAMEQVVARELVVQDALRRGLSISDDDLRKAIARDPSFQENGAFSQEAYLTVVDRRYGGSKTGLDEAYRKELLYNAAVSAVEATAKVPESEVHATWLKNADRVALTLVLFPKAGARAEAKPTDAEVTAFAAKDAARIEKFYADNATRYDQKKQVHVRHLLFKADGPGGKDAARKKADAALARLKKGEDFAKVAAEVSEDPNTKGSGGDLGIIREGLLDDAVGKAAMALDPGKLSDPVESPSGFHVLRVDEVIPAKKTPLAEVKGDIARELLADDKTDALLKERSQAALAAVRSGQGLTTLFPAPAQAKEGEKPPEDKKVVKLGGADVVAQDIGPFPVSTRAPMLGDELLKDAATAKAGDVLPKAYAVPQGIVVGVVKERTRPDEAAYPKERDGVLGSLRQAKASQVRQAWIQGLRAEAKVEENGELLAGMPAQPSPE
jgi:peptidyl-prolyl cis-trans isomerase D